MAARNVAVQLGWLDETHARVQLSADSVSLDALPGKFSGLDLLCSRAVLQPGFIHCPDARLRLNSSEYGRQSLQVSFRYHPVDANWDVNIKGARLPLQPLTAQLAASGGGIPVLEGDGRIAVTASLRGYRSAAGQGATWTLRLQAKEFTDAGGTVAGENLDVALVVEATSG